MVTTPVDFELNSNDLYITPAGLLQDKAGSFKDGQGLGIIQLTKNEVEDELIGKKFFRDVFLKRLREIAQCDEPEDKDLTLLFSQSCPSLEECAFTILELPPLLGAEYFTAQHLLDCHKAFEEALQFQYNNFEGDFTSFLRSLSNLWKNVGKVAFHLAENKGDTTGNAPFAFMASFIYRSTNNSNKHLPLAKALQAYINDKVSLMAILEPLVNVTKKSTFIKGLFDSKRIFQPMALSSNEAYKFLQEISLYEESNIIVRINNLWKRNVPSAKVSVSLGNDVETKFNQFSLLDFAVNVTVDGEVLTPEEIQKILNSRDNLVRIKGNWVVADPENINTLLEKWNNIKASIGKDGLTLVEALKLLSGANELLSDRKKLSFSDDSLEFFPSKELQKVLDKLKNPQGVALPTLPENLAKTLRPYQLDGVKYLWHSTSIGLGVCLADDMGLGKTIQMLTLLKLWKEANYFNKLPALLILPATLLGNWKDESKKFTPDLKIITCHASSLSKEDLKTFTTNPDKILKGYDLALITYGMVTKVANLAKLEFPAVIADEAQAIKNPNTLQSKSVRALKSKCRISLTGTPIENRLGDLWSIFDFINPGLLGNLTKFKEFNKKLLGNYAPLRKLTSPFILRRLKTDKSIIPDLPDKTEKKVYCSLSKEQIILYQNAVEEMRKELLANEEENIKRKGIVLKYLGMFKEICNHPAQFLGSQDWNIEDSGKFLRLKEIIETISSRQERVLIFTQYREMTEPLSNFLAELFGRPGLVIHGGVEVKKRQQLVKEFQNPDGPPFFVLTVKAAGTGLNLTSANHVIHFDRWWNPATENQASDRAFRIGQKRNVLIHKFVTFGTLETKIDDMISEKQHLADDILSTQGTEKLLTQMSNDELLNLVKLDLNNLEV